MTIYCKDYDITEVIHESALTTIFHGVRKLDKTPVVLKLLKPECINDRSSKKIENEFNFLNKIDAPQIIRTYELIPFQKTLLLVLEEFTTRTLKQYLKEESWDLKSLLKVSIDIAEGIGQIHKQNIIHKDIKPANILINPDNKIKIIDFGIATSLAREVQQEIQPDQLEGTITYISPEQTARMNRPIDYRTDIYSFGVTLYELFTHQLPFNANSVLEIIHLHIAQKPMSPCKINTDIPDAVSDVILKCMEKNPDDRYKSAFGLKRDLEKCLSLLESLGKIPRFSLAQNDVYDKFHAPEKIFGREKELKLINDCLEEVWTGNAQMMAICGTSGIGRSCLASEVEKTVTHKEGYYFSVKYDQINEKVPYYGITNVYQKLIHRILTCSDDVVQNWKDRIIECAEGNGQLLIDIIPDLKLIIGEQPKVEELPPQESENRFNYIFKNFMKVMVDPNHPLVIFFDDFQWGDESTIKLITNLLMDNTVKQLLVIISYRGTDLDQLHPLSIALNGLRKAQLKLTFVYLTTLDIESIESIIHDVFPGINDIHTLSAIVKNKTLGNPFFVIQLLKYLYDKELIEFDYDMMKWKIAIEQVTSIEISENVLELLVSKLESLGPEMLNFLKVCSVIGNRLEEDVILKYFEGGIKNTKTLFNLALEEEFIVQAIDKTYQFAHDRIRQLIYSLITAEEKKHIHFSVGQVLLAISSSEQIEKMSIDIINHLNHGLEFPLDNEMKNMMVSLNLKAAIKVKNFQAYHQAIPYFKNVLFLLGDSCWDSKNMETFVTHEYLGECFQLLGNDDQAEYYYNLCLNHVVNRLDEVRIYTKIAALNEQMKNYDKVFESAQKALELLDFPFDMNPGLPSVVLQLIKVKVKLLLNPISKIKKLPVVKNERLSNIYEILSSLGHSSYVTGKQFLWLKLTLTIIELTLKYNITSQHSGAGFLGYAVFLGSEQLGDFDNCYAYGQLGYEMMNLCPTTATSLLGKFLYPYFCYRCKHPLKNSIPLLHAVYKESLIFGNVNVSAQSIVSILAIRFLTGERLSITYQEILDGISEFQKFPGLAELNNMFSFKELCLCLQGVNADPLSFCPVEIMDEVYEKVEIKADRLYILSYRMWHAIMLYLFGRYNEARDEFQILLPFTEKFPGLLEWPMVHLCYSLSLAAPLTTSKDNPADWKQLLRLNKTLKKWSKSCPVRYEMLSLLVQGEVARIENKPSVVIQCLSQAIKKGKIEENYFIIGIGYELFALFYKRIGVTDLTVLFLEKSLYFFETWGAISKCNDLRSRYAEYLSADESPVDVAHEFSLWSKETTHQTTISSHDTYNTISSTFSTTTGESSFDLSTIIEASQTLSQEIEFDRLVQTLMNLMVVNAGANKAFLIIYENSKPFVYSEIYIGEAYRPLSSPLPLEERKNAICVQIVEYVGRARKEILMNNAMEKGPFYQDTYVQTKKPKSILCLPLLQNEIVKGILYLENTESVKAFTQNHLRLLNLLSSQMAISIENAKFYTNLDTKVKSRTKELEEKNIELNLAFKHIQDTQDQLIQKEKLASLGVLTAGIAHELKNPLNFVINFAQIIKDNLKDLKEEIVGNGSKEEKLSLVKEMIDNLTVIDTHGQRSNSIIKGMLSHSRQGSKTLEDVNVNDIVDQAFGLAYYTFRKKEPTFNLKVDKSYGKDMPVIQGYPGDLLRVFINIIDNACYALFDKMKQPIEEYKPHFEIKTSQEEGFLVIILRDNGPGIPQELIDKVFNPFFTTKPAGSGTGLGLSIAYDIIAKEHAGKLELISKMGEMTQFTIKLPCKLGGEG